MEEVLKECQELLMDLIAYNHVADGVCPTINEMIDKIDKALGTI